MITPSDNTKATDGKTLVSWRWDVAARGTVKTETTSQYHGQSLPSLGADELQATTEAKNVHTTSLSVETVTPQTLNDKVLGTDWSTLQRFADEWTVVKTRQSAATLTAGTLSVGASQVEQDFPASWAHDTITVSAWVTRTRIENDDTLGVPVTINEMVVAPGDALPSNTGLKIYSKQEVDTWHAIQREEVVGDGTTAWTRTFYTCEPYSFPGVLTGFTTASAFEEINKRSLLVITANVRQGFNMDVYHKHIETLVSTSEVATLIASTPLGDGSSSALAALVQPVTKDLSYNGVLFSVNVGNVLCNDGTGANKLTASTDPADEYYGTTLVDEFEYTATDITATEYASLVSGGAWHPIRDTLMPWKAGYYIRRRTFIKFL